jgi:hypothetical protein
MIQLKTFLKVIDNSGALVVECINVLGGTIMLMLTSRRPHRFGWGRNCSFREEGKAAYADGLEKCCGEIEKR